MANRPKGASDEPVFSADELDLLRDLLCGLQNHIQDAVVDARLRSSNEELRRITAVTSADTLFRIDEVAEDALMAYVREKWPLDWPVEFVIEGEEPAARIHPEGTAHGELRIKCLLDPVDGSRNLMFDKRSAWTLGAIAPHRGSATRLADTVVAAMTELPVAKQTLADQLSAIRGRGFSGIRTRRADLRSGSSEPFSVEPSRGSELENGFASFVRFLPQGKALLARFEEALMRRLFDETEIATLSIFDDQYLCSGGQFYELLMGHDRMLGDLRPEALAIGDQPSALVCHPYDVCCVLILHEAGCPVTDPRGAPLDAPMDTSTPVSWIGFANPELAARVWPAFEKTYREFFGEVAG